MMYTVFNNIHPVFNKCSTCDSLCLADCPPVFPFSCVHALKREDNYSPTSIKRPPSGL